MHEPPSPQTHYGTRDSHESGDERFFTPRARARGYVSSGDEFGTPREFGRTMHSARSWSSSGHHSDQGYGTPRDFSSSEDVGELWDDSGFYSSRSQQRSSREGLPPMSVPTPFIANRHGAEAKQGGGSPHIPPHGRPPLRAAHPGHMQHPHHYPHGGGRHPDEAKYAEPPRRPHTAAPPGSNFPPPRYREPGYGQPPSQQHYADHQQCQQPPRHTRHPQYEQQHGGGAPPGPRGGGAGEFLGHAAHAAHASHGAPPTRSQQYDNGYAHDGSYYNNPGSGAASAEGYYGHEQQYHSEGGEYANQGGSGQSQGGSYAGGGYYQQKGVSEEDVADIFSMARHNRYEEVEALLDRGVPVNVRDKHGNTVLAVACQNGLKRLAKLSLRRGGDINSRNHKGNTPLHFCFTYGYGDTLGAYLITKGADPTIRNEHGQTCYEGVGKK